MVETTLNVYLCKDGSMFKFVNNFMGVFILMILSQVIMTQVGWIKDTRKVGIDCPHSSSEQEQAFGVQKLHSGEV